MLRRWPTSHLWLCNSGCSTKNACPCIASYCNEKGFDSREHGPVTGASFGLLRRQGSRANCNIVNAIRLILGYALEICQGSTVDSFGRYCHIGRLKKNQIGHFGYFSDRVFWRYSRSANRPYSPTTILGVRPDLVGSGQARVIYILLFKPII